MLRPVSYRWKKSADSNIHYGLIAQETEKAVIQAREASSESNQTIVSYDKKADKYGLKYAELVGPLIKSVQELDKKVLAKDNEITNLKEVNNQLQKRLEAIEKALQK